jgi:CRP-like cAMP-binding protein
VAFVSSDGFRNSVLRSLSDPERERLALELEPRNLQSGFVISEPGDTLTHVWFPETGVASLVAVMSDGALVETGTVGYEGIVGLPLFLGADRWPGRVIWQVPGTAYRLRASSFWSLLGRNPGFRDLIGVAAEIQLIQMAQSVACNRLHPIEQRLARWLLMTHDRAGQDEFYLTQEFLAVMLGVRRASVNEAAGRLRASGTITYRRGHLKVLDRDRLENGACECYEIVASESARLQRRVS